MTLQNKIVEYLKTLPTLHDSESQRAFVYQAGLDQKLQDQISFGKPRTEFVPLFVATLIQYGTLKDGRNALETVLDATKHYIGHDKKVRCQTLLQELQSNIKKPKTSSKHVQSSTQTFYSSKWYKIRTVVFILIISFSFIGSYLFVYAPRHHFKKKEYTGKPISLHFTEADIRDVLQVIAEVSELNLAIHPDVTGKVTTTFKDLPWDQALDMILDMNNLHGKIEGEVIRIRTHHSQVTSVDKKEEYVGEPLSLQFSETDILEILQVIAEVYELNLAIHSDVSRRNISVCLEAVPWDQALDIVLEMGNLRGEIRGDILWIEPIYSIY